MRKYLISLSSLVLFFSCIGGKSVPVEFYTLNLKGESPTAIKIASVRSSVKIHQRMNLKNGTRLELREFERWQAGPDRLIETELKNYFALGGDDLYCDLSEFVFDLESNEAQVSMDFTLSSEDGTKKFRLKSAQEFTALDGESLANAMSLAVQDLFKQLDKKLIAGK